MSDSYHPKPNSHENPYYYVDAVHIQLQSEIDQLANRFYDLTPEEIAMIEDGER
jgi:hypothetical protein